jgi:hypothetical protein
VTEDQYNNLNKYGEGLECIRKAQYSPFNHMETQALAVIYTEITGNKANLRCPNCIFDMMVRLIKQKRVYENEHGIAKAD